MAVLELQGEAVPPDVRMLFSDELRGATIDHLPEHFVFTRENLEARLAEKGIPIGNCLGDFCEVELGRRMEVGLVMSGRLLRLDDLIIATIKLHETADGRLIGQESAEAASANALRPELRRAARNLCAKVSAPPPIPPPTIDLASVRVEVDPPTAYVQVDDGAPVPVSQGRTRLRLAPGQHRIQLFAAGRAPVDTTVQALSGADLGLRFRLREVRGQPPPPSGSGMLVVDSSPSGASVFLDGAAVGSTPSCTVAGLRPGSYTMRVELPDHHSHEELVTIEEHETLRVGASLRPAFALVSVDTDPPGATLFLGGRAAGTSPLVERRVASGSVALRAQLPHFHERDTTLTLSDGQTIQLSLTLAPAHGRIEIASTPPGATILLDGARLAETTPINLPVVASGPHSIRLELAQHHPAVRSFRLRDGETVALSETLRPAFALLDVRSTPSGLPVTVNDRSMGRTPVRDARVTRGHLVVVAGADTLIAERRELILAEGEHRRLDLSPRRKTGALTLISDPPGARVRVDGRWLSERTPLIHPNCPTGKRRLRFELDEHIPAERSVDLRWKEQPEIRVGLESYAGSALAQANRWRWRKRLSLAGIVAAAGGGVYAWIEADASYDDYRGAETQGAAEEARKRTERFDVVKIACAGTAGALLVPWGVSWVKERSHRRAYDERRAHASEPSRLRLAAGVAGDGIRFGVEGRF